VHKVIEVNDVALHVEDSGEGPSILTLHGGPGMGSRHGDIATYGPFAKEGYRVVSYDQRGNGDSDGRSPYSHDQFVEDAEALRQKLGLGKIIIAGGSYGGYIAQEYALKYPENLVGMILRDTAPSNDYRHASKERAMNSRLPGITEENLDRLFSGHVRSNEEFKSIYGSILPLYRVQATEKDLQEHLDSICFRYETHNWAFSKNQKTFNLVPRLSSIKVPTLILVGRHDWITPLEASMQLSQGISNSRLVIFERSGHSPQIEEREKFQSEVREFLHQVFKS